MIEIQRPYNDAAGVFMDLNYARLARNSFGENTLFSLSTSKSVVFILRENTSEIEWRRRHDGREKKGRFEMSIFRVYLVLFRSVRSEYFVRYDTETVAPCHVQGIIYEIYDRSLNPKIN